MLCPLFIIHLLTKYWDMCLLCVRCCSRHWRYNSEQSRQKSFHTSYLLAGETNEISKIHNIVFKRAQCWEEKKAWYRLGGERDRGLEGVIFQRGRSRSPSRDDFWNKDLKELKPAIQIWGENIWAVGTMSRNESSRPVGDRRGHGGRGRSCGTLGSKKDLGFSFEWHGDHLGVFSRGVVWSDFRTETLRLPDLTTGCRKQG